MKEIPILFSGPMISAILDGRKSQTRRIVKEPYQSYPIVTKHITTCEFDFHYDQGVGQFTASPYGKQGTILWVRETWCYVMYDHCHDLLEGAKDRNQTVYKASVHPDWMEYAKEKYGYKWKSPIFMPKESCRIKLLVEDIRVERLQDITEGDAIAEGIIELAQSRMQLIQNGKLYKDYNKPEELFNEGLKAIDSYKSLWESINGKGSWEKSQFVWVIKFKQIK